MLHKLKSDLLAAQKSQDAVKLRSLRVLLAEVKNKEIEFRPLNKEITDTDVVGLLQKGIKSRMESIEMFKKGNREDLVKKEQEEIDVLKTYLPEMMGEEEIKKIVMDAISSTGAASVSDMGKVMGAIKGELAGKADMTMVSRIVKEILSR